ncbi:gig suppressor [Fusarium falciforme]
MSSLSRRACYKCGNVGHYAEVCSSAERLCYNCKQPGHESNGCPLPRTTEAKQCYHCQAAAATTAASLVTLLAPALTLLALLLAVAPPWAAAASPVATAVVVSLAAPVPLLATSAVAPNHFARDCQAQAMKCYACGKLGHISRDCTAPNGGPLNTAGKTCYQCGEAGHISRDCPQKNAPGEIPPEVDLSNVPAPPVAPIAPVA